MKSEYIILLSNPFRGFSLLLSQSPNSLKVANTYGMAKKEPVGTTEAWRI